VTTTPPRALAATLCLAASVASQAGALPADRAPGAAAVHVDHCKEWLGTLASPEFEGRGTGQEGFRKAAQFVRERFLALGLQARGDGDNHLQAVPWSSAAADTSQTRIEFTRPDGVTITIPAARLEGRVARSEDAAGPAVLVVLPAAAEAATQAEGEAKDGSPEAAGLEGRVVVIHVQPGPDGPPNGTAINRAVARIRESNPAAVVVLQSAPVRGGVTARGGPGRGGANRAVRGTRLIPGWLAFGGDDATALLAAGGAKDALATPCIRDLGLTAKVGIVVDTSNTPAWNVVGVLPGSDPALAGEYVVVGSHLDHLGRRGNRIYPGADDDGSGTTGVLAVATMFAKNQVRPKRSILFVCFCGEESGLVGSRFFADHCPVPLESIVAELQMDMIGRHEESDDEPATDNLNSLHLIGTRKLSEDLHELCLEKNETARFDLEWDEEDVFFRSDHANFAKKGIPIAFFFTGFHHDYHQPSDTPDKIDYDKLLRVATYVYDIAFDLGTMSGRPLVDEELWAANRQKLNGPETPAAPLRRQ